MSIPAKIALAVIIVALLVGLGTTLTILYHPATNEPTTTSAPPLPSAAATEESVNDTNPFAARVSNPFDDEEYSNPFAEEEYTNPFAE